MLEIIEAVMPGVLLIIFGFMMKWADNHPELFEGD